MSEMHGKHQMHGKNLLCERQLLMEIFSAPSPLWGEGARSGEVGISKVPALGHTP